MKPEEPERKGDGRLKIPLFEDEIIEVTNESAHISPKASSKFKKAKMNRDLNFQKLETRSDEIISDQSIEPNLDSKMLQKADSTTSYNRRTYAG